MISNPVSLIVKNKKIMYHVPKKKGGSKKKICKNNFVNLMRISNSYIDEIDCTILEFLNLVRPLAEYLTLPLISNKNLKSYYKELNCKKGNGCKFENVVLEKEVQMPFSFGKEFLVFISCYGKKKGSKENFAIEYTPIYKYRNAKIKIIDKINVSPLLRNKIVLKSLNLKYEDIDDSIHLPIYGLKLNEIIYSIFDEISFFGPITERKKQNKKLKKLHAEAIEYLRNK